MSEKEWICPICGQSFNTKRLYKEHHKTVHPKQKAQHSGCCMYCGKEFVRLNALSLHENHWCKNNPNIIPIEGTNNLPKVQKTKEDGWKCPICNEVFRTKDELKEHKKKENHYAVHNTKYRLTDSSKKDIIYTCQYCGRTTNSRHGNSNHELHCIENPNRKCGSMFGKKLSEETKEKISSIRKDYLKENPDKVPYLLNHSSKESYPETYWKELIEKENLPLQYHLQIGVYQLDFYNKEKMIDLEINGGTHYLVDKTIEIDKRRTEYLQSIGWKVIPLNWSEWCKKNKKDKELFIEYLKNLLK